MDWKMFGLGAALFVVGMALVFVIGFWAVGFTFTGGALMGWPIGEVIAKWSCQR